MFKHVVTLTLGSQLNVKRNHEAKSVFRCETHVHKWGRVQGMKPMTPKCIPTLGIALV
jgi:hypothetical protein